MRFTMGQYLVMQSPLPGVKVVRFTRPDLRPQLEDTGDTDTCELYEELQCCVLESLEPGDRLVLNLGLVEVFPSALLCLLILVRSVVLQRQGRLVLCQIGAEHRELFDVTSTLGLFTIVPTEREAIFGPEERAEPA